MEGVEATEMPAEQSTLLDSISDECLGYVTRYLAYSDLVLVELIGCKLLNTKLYRCVQEIEHFIGACPKFPTSILSFSHLRSLTLKPSYDCHYGFQPAILPNNGSKLMLAHKTLENLQITSVLALTLLDHEVGQPSLASLLPNLKILKINSDHTFLPRMLHNLPSTLIEFELVLSRNRHRFLCPEVPIMDFARLPRSLTSLVCQNLTFAIRKTKNFGPPSPSNFPGLFPPHLTKLAIETSHDAYIIKYAPRSLTDLSVEACDLSDDQNEVEEASMDDNRLPKDESDTLDYDVATRIMLSDLPSNLTSFALHHEFHLWRTFVPDASFPANLTRLSIPSECVIEGQDEGIDFASVFPPSLMWIEGIHFNYLLPNQRNLILGSHQASVCPESPGYLSFPLPSLHTLDCSAISPLPTLITAFPSTITKLVCNLTDSPQWAKAILNMPKLKHLRCPNARTPIPFSPFWEVLHTQLESLETSVEHFDRIESVLGPWINLKSLIVWRSLEHGRKRKSPSLGLSLPFAVDWSVPLDTLPSLPSTLRRLVLQDFPHPAFFHNLCSLSSLEELSLPEVDPIIVGAGVIPASVDEIAKNAFWSFLEKLPHSLHSLSICIPSNLPRERLDHLPRHLSVLTLTIIRVEERIQVVLPHPHRIPASLIRIRILPSTLSASLPPIAEYRCHITTSPGKGNPTHAHLELKRQLQIPIQ